MRDCPKCQHRHVDGPECPDCGYRDSGYKGQAVPADHGCAHVDRGQRCTGVGSLSQSTKGGGPWYCATHFPLFATRGSATPMPTHVASTFARVRASFETETVAEREAIRGESLYRAETEAET